MSEAEKNRKSRSDRFYTIFYTVVIALLVMNTFVVKLAFVDGHSMYPTLHDRQLMLVLRPGYEPEQGDVIVIHTGKGIFSRDYIVKRVIATAGQTVTIDYDRNEVSVNGIILQEPYLNFEEEDPMLPRDGRSIVTETVPEGRVFVMGDNRNHSADSRSDKYGMIDVKRIVGKVIFPVIP